jgi:oxidase EvaA
MSPENTLVPAARGPLIPRATGELAARLACSAAVTDAGRDLRTQDVSGWLDSRRAAHSFTVDRIPFADLDAWSFAPETGNLGHRSGRFFTIEGLRVTVEDGVVPEWEQPIINQPEIGVLGILAKKFDGVLHFLMNAKMEPGNPNLLQLSPTVQATRSNYTRQHQGTGVKFIEYFLEPRRGRVLTDVLQSEHGSWFHRKFNRNMIVETFDDVPPDDDFRWLTVGQIGVLLQDSNIVNMDARTVLACVSPGRGESRALLSDTALLSWITEQRSRHLVTARRIPLRGVTGWTRGDDVITHDEGRYFSVVAVRVRAGNREVTSWTQPLFAPHGLGVNAFLVRQVDGVPHLLARARVEAGLFTTTELGPTVQCTPSNYAHLPSENRPAFLDLVLGANRERILYEAVHSEEGGRFLAAQSRYLFVTVDESEAPLVPPAGYQWVTLGQLRDLARHGGYVNVQARTLLACLNTGAVRCV